MPDLLGSKIAYYGYSGPINSDGTTRLASAFNAAVNNEYDHVYLCLNSLGGFVGEGIYLYNHIRSLPVRTTIHNIGSVCSIAVAVFVAGEERYCSAHSLFLIHPTTIGPFSEGLAYERLSSAMGAALAEDERTENILRERTRLPDDLLSARRVRDVHLKPGEAFTHGLVNEVREFTLPQGHQIIQV